MKPFSNFKVHFSKITVILCTIALGAFAPVTGQMDFISTPCYAWAGRNEARTEGPHQAVSALAGAGAALHMHILSQAIIWAKASELAFQPTSVIGCTLETYRIQTVYTRSKWNREVKISCTGWIHATFPGMHFAVSNKRGHEYWCKSYTPSPLAE